MGSLKNNKHINDQTSFKTRKLYMPKGVNVKELELFKDVMFSDYLVDMKKM